MFQLNIAISVFTIHVFTVFGLKFDISIIFVSTKMTIFTNPGVSTWSEKSGIIKKFGKITKKSGKVTKT